MMNIYLREMHVMSRETAVVVIENNTRNERRLYRRINEQRVTGIIYVTNVMGKIAYCTRTIKMQLAYNHIHLYYFEL